MVAVACLKATLALHQPRERSKPPKHNQAARPARVSYRAGRVTGLQGESYRMVCYNIYIAVILSNSGAYSISYETVYDKVSSYRGTAEWPQLNDTLI